MRWSNASSTGQGLSGCDVDIERASETLEAINRISSNGVFDPEWRERFKGPADLDGGAWTP